MGSIVYDSRIQFPDCLCLFIGSWNNLVSEVHKNYWKVYLPTTKRLQTFFRGWQKHLDLIDHCETGPTSTSTSPSLVKVKGDLRQSHAHLRKCSP